MEFRHYMQHYSHNDRDDGDETLMRRIINRYECAREYVRAFVCIPA